MTHRDHTPNPIVLFDGVCNLCHSSVRWIISHDRRSVFRFAALQSRAAREALAAAGTPPEHADALDSVVAIIDGHVRTRSDAAIAIATRLGFPWSLARIALVVPKPVRDAAYTMIARHRYQWFGRQNACMVPTPELRARFLDADEPRSPAIPPDAPPALYNPPATGPLIAVRSWLHRLIIIYLFLHIFCFPIGDIPGTEIIADTYQAALRAVVTWFASATLGITITVFPAGSGDTTFNYIQLLVFIITSVLTASAWAMIARGRAVSARSVDLFNIYVRYFLASILLSYGWVKVFPLQMAYPGPDRLLATYGDSSPMGLLWTFIGSSPAFQSFSGSAEVLAGALLLFRRTTLLGSILAVGVLTNVVAFNLFYDVPVKIFSTHLLVLAIFLLAPHVPRLVGVLIFNLPSQSVVLRPFPIRSVRLRRAASAAKLAFILFFAILPVYWNGQDYLANRPSAPKPSWHGLYRVESFIRDNVADRLLPDADRWVRVGITAQTNDGRNFAILGIQSADGSSRRWGAEVSADPPLFTFMQREKTAPPKLAFSMISPDTLRFEGEYQGALITATVKRIPLSESVLLGRGFRWINEFPFNR